MTDTLSPQVLAEIAAERAALSAIAALQTDLATTSALIAAGNYDAAWRVHAASFGQRVDAVDAGFGRLALVPR